MLLKQYDLFITILSKPFSLTYLRHSVPAQAESIARMLYAYSMYSSVYCGNGTAAMLITVVYLKLNIKKDIITEAV